MMNIKEILENHKKWLHGEGGCRAILRGADLRHANLNDADLSDADLRHAILRGADLRHANLNDAILRGANLWDCNGNQKQIKSLFMFEKYMVAYTSEYLQIGCENHRISEWWEFDDERIARMDEGALDWWKENKAFIRSVIEKYPAVPTW
jgi:hypothetical protein